MAGIFAWVARGMQFFDSSGMTRFCQLGFGDEGDMPDEDDWRETCEELGTAPTQGLSLEMFQQMLADAPEEMLAEATRKIREGRVRSLAPPFTRSSAHIHTRRSPPPPLPPCPFHAHAPPLPRSRHVRVWSEPQTHPSRDARPR